MPILRSGKDSGPPSNFKNKGSRGKPLPITARLPPELITRILSCLSGDHPALRACCLVSKDLYALTSPILWRRLRLTPWTTDDMGNQVLDAKREKHGRITVGRRTGRSDMERLRNHVKVFTIESHDSWWCTNPDGKGISLELPNLQTLEIENDQSWSQAHRDHPLSWGNCRLLASIQPSTLVLRQAATNRMLVGNPKSMHCNVLKAALEGVQELVCVSDSQQAFYDYCFVRTQPLPFVTRLKRCMWVFEPAGSGTRIDPITNCTTSPRSHMHAGAIVSAVVESRSVPFTFVNIAAVDYALVAATTHTASTTGMLQQSGPSQENTERSDDVLRRKLTAEMEYYGWDQERQLERQETVKFVTLEEYLATERWWDHFEPDEVERWTRYMRELEGKFSRVLGAS